MRIILFSPAVFAFLLIFVGYPDARSQSLIERFNKIGQEPQTIHFTSSLPLNEEGGHLQGIQVHSSGGKEAFVLSGSSSTYAYYLTVNDRKVQEVVELDQVPFKHAGGFQLADGYLAIGIEDDEARNKANVLIFEADGEIKEHASWSIAREGAEMRSTAGCVAVARQGDEVLVVVGDWDARHLDFYKLDPNRKGESPAAPFATLTIADLPRGSWVESTWHSYQNINLLSDRDGSLYLVGLASNWQKQNIADLFRLSPKGNTYELTKVASRNFPAHADVQFRAGAGIRQLEDGTLQVLACSDHVEGQGIIQIWQ